MLLELPSSEVLVPRKDTLDLEQKCRELGVDLESYMNVVLWTALNTPSVIEEVDAFHRNIAERLKSIELTAPN
jgi:hypothetical protein